MVTHPLSNQTHHPVALTQHPFNAADPHPAQTLTPLAYKTPTLNRSVSLLLWTGWLSEKNPAPPFSLSATNPQKQKPTPSSLFSPSPRKSKTRRHLSPPDSKNPAPRIDEKAPFRWSIAPPVYPPPSSSQKPPSLVRLPFAGGRRSSTFVQASHRVSVREFKRLEEASRKGGEEKSWRTTVVDQSSKKRTTIS